jgi:hypothetical protein
MSKSLSKSEALISLVASRALAEKSGEHDYPMADAYTAAHRLRGETKLRALRVLRALESARFIAGRWAEFSAYSHQQRCAAWCMGTVPHSWFTPEFQEFQQSRLMFHGSLARG